MPQDAVGEVGGRGGSRTEETASWRKRAGDQDEDVRKRRTGSRRSKASWCKGRGEWVGDRGGLAGKTR